VCRVRGVVLFKEISRDEGAVLHLRGFEGVALGELPAHGDRRSDGADRRLISRWSARCPFELSFRQRPP
jgi:hypothetical protein